MAKILYFLNKNYETSKGQILLLNENELISYNKYGSEVRGTLEDTSIATHLILEGLDKPFVFSQSESYILIDEECKFSARSNEGPAFLSLFNKDIDMPPGLHKNPKNYLASPIYLND